MKIYFYLILIFLIVSNAVSQPVITNNTIPQIGDKYYFTECDTTGVLQGDGGQNKTWDFSNLKLKSGTEAKYSYQIVAPESGLANDKFPGANYAYKSGNAYGYYKSSSNMIERMGTGFADTYELLSDYEIFAKFPFEIGDNFTDEFSGTMNLKLSGMDATMKRGGTIKVESDGYGKLILPQGTFYDLLRIKYTQIINDTVVINIPGAPPVITKTETITYSWQNDNYKFSLLSISFIRNFQYVMGNETVTYAGNVVIQDAEPQNSQKLSEPEILSPNKSQLITLPFKVKWSESKLGSIINSVNEFNEEINYVLQVTDNSSWDDPNLIKEYQVGVATEYLLNDDFKGGNLLFRVKSVLGNIESDWSITTTAIYDKGNEKLPPPTLVLPENNSIDVNFVEPQFIWFAVADSIEIEVFNDETNYSYAGNNENGYIINLLSYNTEYSWRVRQFNENGEKSEWSEVWKFKTKNFENRPASPLRISPENGAKDVDYKSTTLEWNAEHKRVEIELYNENLSAGYSGEYENRIILEDLEPDTKYYWRIRQFDNIGVDSEWSEEWSFTTKNVSSVNDNSNLGNSISIFPNPVKNILEVGFEITNNSKFELKILDIEGRIIDEYNLGNLNVGNYNEFFDMSKLTSGKYFVIVNGINQNFTKSFIKE